MLPILVFSLSLFAEFIRAWGLAPVIRLCFWYKHISLLHFLWLILHVSRQWGYNSVGHPYPYFTSSTGELYISYAIHLILLDREDTLMRNLSDLLIQSQFLFMCFLLNVRINVKYQMEGKLNTFLYKKSKLNSLTSCRIISFVQETLILMKRETVLIYM